VKTVIDPGKGRLLAGLVSLAVAAGAAMAPASAVAQDALAECSPPDGWIPAWSAPAPDPYFEGVAVGVDAFSTEFAVEVEQQVGPDWTQESQDQGVQALAAMGTHSFSVYPADAHAANGLYEELAAEGATIVNFGASTALPTPASLLVATDVRIAAMQATEALVTAMAESGNIVNVLKDLEDPATLERKAGIEEVVAKYPDVTIIQEVSGVANTEEAAKAVAFAVAANAEVIDGIIATDATTSVAVAQVVTDYVAAGGRREIHAVGFDMDPVVMTAIADGVMTGTVAQNPSGHGYLSLLALACMENGYAPRDGVYLIDAGTVVVTTDNLETFTEDLVALTHEVACDLPTTYLAKPGEPDSSPEA
jgi:ribose transport system substrate-binding protein